jgi:hypothetical protein
MPSYYANIGRSPMSYSKGDALLEGLSLAGEMDWETFKGFYYSVHANSKETSALDFQTSRADDMRVLDMLAYCDFNFSYGAHNFSVCPSTIYTPLFTQEPVGILTGARFPGLAQRAELIAKEADVEMASPARTRFMLPQPVYFKAESTGVLEALASELGVPFVQHPAAYLALALPPVHSYLEGLAWQPMPTTSFECSFFSPYSHRFEDTQTTKDMHLIRFSDRVTSLPRFMLVNQAQASTVDPDWGRWIVAGHSRVSSFIFDRAQHVLMWPRTMPLPKMFARALALSTPTLPAMAPHTRESYYCLQGIEPWLFDLIALKLGAA